MLADVIILHCSQAMHAKLHGFARELAGGRNPCLDGILVTFLETCTGSLITLHVHVYTQVIFDSLCLPLSPLPEPLSI